ncbi:energy transducer TonB [Tunicatimonas pelagia]|uniref:energy transducer TonB n=1 Tax=Tunicatimonas pelagia TaxID=931531 RepID=UPI00266615B5|nr:energy transducer TonB [Tunicatimonas pelagia]WKN40648.1 energy transducer TonB [Tunicatimonas pelagia]
MLPTTTMFRIPKQTVFLFAWAYMLLGGSTDGYAQTQLRSYQQIKAVLKEISTQKNQIVRKYYSSTRDLQLAYKKQISSRNASASANDTLALEVKLLRGVATDQELTTLDSLDDLQQQLATQLKRVPDQGGVYDTVDELPQPKKGMEDFYRYITQSLRYPTRARQKQIEGKVYVQFVVNEFGSVADAKVLRGLGEGCDREALRVVHKSPAWKPGKIDGNAVRSRVILPITFQLRQEGNGDPLENFVVTTNNRAQSYEEIRRTLLKINRLKAEIMQRHYTSSRDLQLAYQAQVEQASAEGEEVAADISLLEGVLTAEDVVRLTRLDEISSNLREKLKYYPNADGVYEVVDTPPQPADGYTAFYQYLGKHLRYPESAVENNVQGKVYVQLIIDKNGEVLSRTILKGIGSGCDREAQRVLKRMPNWKPALTDGQPVRAKAIVPISFKLGE